MKVINTGFLLSDKYKYKKQYKENSLSITHQTISINQESPLKTNSNITFRSSFFNLKNIKDFFNFYKKEIDENKVIDKETAKQIIINELNNAKVSCKPGHIDSLLNCPDNLTPAKTKILAKLYIIHLKTKGDNKQPYLNIHQEMRFFCDKEGKVNTQIFDKMYKLQTLKLKTKTNRDLNDIHNIRVLTLNCRDRKGYHPELIDLYDSSFFNTNIIKQIRKNGIVNVALISLIKELDKLNNTRHNIYNHKEFIKAVYNKSNELDIPAVESIKRHQQYISEHREYTRSFTNYINYSKDSHGNYKKENEEALTKLLNVLNSSREDIRLFTIWDCSLEKPNKISLEKISVATEALNLFKDDNSNGSREKLLRLLNGDMQKLEACKILKENLISSDLEKVTEILDYCIPKSKKYSINSKTINIIKDLSNNYQLNTCDIKKYLKTILTANNAVNQQKHELIINNHKRTGLEIPVLLDLANIYLNKYDNNPEILKDFDKFVDNFLGFIDKHFKNYLISREDEEDIKQTILTNKDIKIAYNSIVGSQYKNWVINILTKTLTPNGIDPKQLEIANNLPKYIHIENSPNILSYFKDISSKDFLDFLDVLKLAKNNKQLLRDAGDDLTDFDIEEEFGNNANILTKEYQKLGKTLFTYAFKLKIDNFISFIKASSNIQDYWEDKLKPLICPHQTKEYKNAKKEILKLKKELANQVPQEQIILQEKNSLLIENLKKEITVIKNKLKTNPNNDSLRKEIQTKNKEIKQLNNQIQDFYKQENFKELINKINENQKILYKYDDEQIKDFDEIIKHIKTINILHQNYSEDDVDYYINNMTKKDSATKKELNNFIHNKIFEKIDVQYNDTIAKHINLTNSKYLTNLIQEEDSDFWDLFEWLCKALDDNNAQSTKEILDNIAENIETKNMFKSLNIDYDKWTTVDTNSYVKVEVKTNVEKAKQGAIKNLEEDLNSKFWNDIPIEETKKIFDAITNAGFEIKINKEIIYDENGYAIDTHDVKRIYYNKQPVEFTKLPNVIKAIKQVMNQENFWNESTDDEQDALTEQAKNTLLTHIFKMREKEYEVATNMKDDESAILEVHKTDMNNINHALFLGNHACCCTAVGSGCNSWSAPEYIINKCISSIEVMDNKNFVGNTMCFIANVDGNLSLILDNIELNPRYQYNNKIRDAIFEYAKKLCAEIGRPDLKIYAGENRHKVNLENYQLKKHDIEIIGATGSEVYIDSIGNTKIKPKNLHKNIKLYEIR